MIPTQALIPKLKGQSVLVMRQGKAKMIDVEIGQRTEQYVQITSGDIHQGDTLITTNILRIKDGNPVRVTVK
jgi:membrane fusion protein (multidrug efflux system)